MKMNTGSLIASILLIIPQLFSCDNFNTDFKTQAASPATLVQMDHDFSAMSQRVGMRKAFIHYMADDGVLLRPGFTPIVGADAVEFLSQINDTDYTVSWEPLKGHISQSGDLGYTYGTYKVALEDTVFEGTYVNIWRKKNGQWKFVLETGNKGISDEPAP